MSIRVYADYGHDGNSYLGETLREALNNLLNDYEAGYDDMNAGREFTLTVITVGCNCCKELHGFPAYVLHGNWWHQHTAGRCPVHSTVQVFEELPPRSEER